MSPNVAGHRARRSSFKRKKPLNAEIWKKVPTLTAYTPLVNRLFTIHSDVVKRRSFHSLRHSFASWLAEADVHADIRQKLTGHSSAGIHARYTHHDEALDRAVGSLPDL